jgi:hypothetical protein
VLGHERRGGLQDGVVHLVTVRLDRLVPQPRHPARIHVVSDADIGCSGETRCRVN